MKNKTTKTFCFDLDDVICTTKNRDYLKALPKKRVIKLINNLYENGHHIKIFTGRYMGRYKDNRKRAYSEGFKMTFNQLKKWNLKFHKLIMGKPSFDIFVDDKAFGFKKNWYKSFQKFTKNKYD